MKSLVTLSILCHSALLFPIDGFIPKKNGPIFLPNQNSLIPAIAKHQPPSSSLVGTSSRSSASSIRLYMAKLWERMQIEEDPEPMWYILNCVAGLEIDLLRLCRQRCDEMEDVETFVVPIVTSTRSHGANRMVKDTKVKYLGYVFAKLRLCAQTYEAVQDLDLCRSWMGTIHNGRGMKKLPPAPVALNEDEIEKFGLEDMRFEEDDEEEDGIIVDSEEKDKEAKDFEDEIQKLYKGFKVDDMVKITAKGKFINEEGIVRRLKESKLMVRFFTYGTMYEEWFDPDDVRKLDSLEIIKGLQGPSEPVTQRDIDGPGEDDDRRGGDRYGANRRPEGMGRDLAGGMGGDPRNRKQDRTADRFSQASDRQNNRERENWNWYKDNEKGNQGGKHTDGDIDIRGGNRDNKNFAQGDADSQWGRGQQRDNRREQRPDQQRPREQSPRKPSQNARSGDDWSSFVSPAKPAPSQTETDDFFASLMTDLSKDLDSGKGQMAGGNSGGSSDEDDFFASLMSQMPEEENAKPSPPKSKPKPTSENSNDDFFASLETDISGPNRNKPGSTKPEPAKAVDELDDFFAELGAFDDDSSSSSAPQGEADDFFAGLEAELESELSKKSPEPMKASTDDAAFDLFDAEPEVKQAVKQAAKQAAKTPTKKQTLETPPTSSSSLDPASLKKNTVPALKDLLRERGLKVSGKKAELIERLIS